MGPRALAIAVVSIHDIVALGIIGHACSAVRLAPQAGRPADYQCVAMCAVTGMISLQGAIQH